MFYFQFFFNRYWMPKVDVCAVRCASDRMASIVSKEVFNPCKLFAGERKPVSFVLNYPEALHWLVVPAVNTPQKDNVVNRQQAPQFTNMNYPVQYSGPSFDFLRTFFGLSTVQKMYGLPLSFPTHPKQTHETVDCWKFSGEHAHL